MKRLMKNKVVLAVFALVLLGALAATYAYTRPSNTAVTPTRGNTIKNQPANYDDTKATPKPTSSASKTSTPAPAGTPQPLSKPTFQKSSGNAPGSSVPNGAAMEFTCDGTLNSSCEIILTDRNNPNKVITLTAKPITSNGRGEYFATWSWTAVSGSWSIQARTSNNAGSSTLSDTQTLEVKS